MGQGLVGRDKVYRINQGELLNKQIKTATVMIPEERTKI